MVVLLFCAPLLALSLRGVAAMSLLSCALVLGTIVEALAAKAPAPPPSQSR